MCQDTENTGRREGVRYCKQSSFCKQLPNNVYPVGKGKEIQLWLSDNPGLVQIMDRSSCQIPVRWLGKWIFVAYGQVLWDPMKECAVDEKTSI